MPNKQIAIQVRGLRKKLGPNQALDGVDLTLDAGLLHGLIGPDGAGKTTLGPHPCGPVAARTKAASSSRRTVIQPPSPRCGPFMAYMPQQQSLYPDLSVSEHMDFFRDLYQIPPDVYKQRREELLHITRLNPFVDRPASKLSGGMYKKLGLMCALLQSPNVVCWTNPPTGWTPLAAANSGIFCTASPHKASSS
jgi:ABC-2 type transport system ATP-binding protein